MAAAKKQTYLKDYKRLGAEEGWHFLDGSRDIEQGLGRCRRISLRLRCDDQSVCAQQRHHDSDASGADYALLLRHRLSVARRPARAGRGFERTNRQSQRTRFCCIASTTIRPPESTRLVVMNVLRLAALITLGVLATFLIVMFRRDYRARASAERTT